MSAIEEVKARVDIVDLISRYTQLKRAGTIYKGLCPFHSERTPSFVVFPNTGTWHCFGTCGAGGDVFSFLMRKENMEFHEALELLAKQAGVVLDDRGDDPDRNQRASLLDINDAAAQYFREVLLHHSAAQPARDYLQRRQIDSTTAQHFQIGFGLESWNSLRDHLSVRGFSLEQQLAAGLVKRHEERDSIYDAFRNRVMIPIRDRQGRTIGFGGRVLDDSQPKYLNTAETPLFHKSHVVFGLDFAQQAIRAADRVVIVEGYMDVIAAHQHGFANVVACMGTALTSEQLRQLQRFTSNYVLALDADAAGQAATIRGLNQARMALTRVSKPTVQPGGHLQLTERLSANLSIVSMPDGLDPDDVIRRNPAQWLDLVGQSTPLVDFYFAVVAQRFDLTGAAGKATAVSELAPLIAELGDEVERQHYVHQLSRLVQIDEVVIDSRVKAAARTAQLPQTQPERRTQAGQEKDRGTGRAPELAQAMAAAPPSAQSQGGVDHEDHLLAMLLREPDLLVWLAQTADQLNIDPPRVDDLQRTDNKEIFRALKTHMTSDEAWDLEQFQDALVTSLHPKLAKLVAYGAQLPARSDGELHEGMIKDIVHLRLQRLKAESIAIKALVDEAQRSGDPEAARSLGSVYGRIQRELDRLQPLKLRQNHQTPGWRARDTAMQTSTPAPRAA